MQQQALIMDIARDRGVIGMERSAARADRASPGWTEAAVEKLLEQVQTIPHKQKFTIEAIRLVIEPNLTAPPDKRAWGQVTQMAIRRLYIEKTDTFSAAASSHGAPKPEYVRGRTV